MRNSVWMVLGDRSGHAGRAVHLSGARWNADSGNIVLMEDASAGSGPPEKRPEFFLKSLFSTQTFTLIVGVLVMVLILFCNNWIIKAQSVFANLERVNSAFDSFDHTDLVAMYDLCDQNKETVTPSDLARMIRIGKMIQIHDALLAEAQDTASDLNNRLEWPTAAVSQADVLQYEQMGQLGGWGGTQPVPAGATELAEKSGASDANGAAGQSTTDANAAAYVAQPRTEKEIVCESFLSNPSDLIQQYNVWRTSLKGFSDAFDIRRTQPMFTGKGPGTNLILEHKLRAKMTIITMWWLPILNGALGAIIFCLTRMLKDKSTAPKLGEIVLRMVFGGFAGLLVSILLLPSGVAFGQFVGNAPGVSLLAFVFGFSLDSFIQLLERMNQLVIESTTSKKSEKPEG